ncbi:hypothetical protein BKA64DRAFT_640103 [Cadophora sp. MPI-SDFR-AT-0126]|nr:hypothetical protein BKA64DRAFT_640103 [Leotiomycetes sp. MPI-SDFR-AT-0126]
MKYGVSPFMRAWAGNITPVVKNGLGRLLSAIIAGLAGGLTDRVSKRSAEVVGKEKLMENVTLRMEEKNDWLWRHYMEGMKQKPMHEGGFEGVGLERCRRKERRRIKERERVCVSSYCMFVGSEDPVISADDKEHAAHLRQGRNSRGALDSKGQRVGDSK